MNASIFSKLQNCPEVISGAHLDTLFGAKEQALNLCDESMRLVLQPIGRGLFLNRTRSNQDPYVFELKVLRWIGERFFIGGMTSMLYAGWASRVPSHVEVLVGENAWIPEGVFERILFLRRSDRVMEEAAKYVPSQWKSILMVSADYALADFVIHERHQLTTEDVDESEMTPQDIECIRRHLDNAGVPMPRFIGQSYSLAPSF